MYYAAALIFAALVFDILDGRIARWRQKSSALGRELDSLADVISFGVAPAIIGYGGGMRGLYDRCLLVYFVACGVSRLARYKHVVWRSSVARRHAPSVDAAVRSFGFVDDQSYPGAEILIAPC